MNYVGFALLTAKSSHFADADPETIVNATFNSFDLDKNEKRSKTKAGSATKSATDCDTATCLVTPRKTASKVVVATHVIKFTH